MSIRLLALACLFSAWSVLAAEPDAGDFCGGPELEVDAAFPLSDAQCAKLSALHAAREHGLDPADYRLQDIEMLAAHSLNAKHERLDELLDEAYRKFASDVSRGRVDPELADPDWHIPSRRGGPDDESKPRDEAIAASPFPPHPAYARLRTAMTTYLEIQSGGGWPILPDGPSLSVGMRDQAVEIARKRLLVTGDFDADVEADAWLFGAGLDAAVRAFQARHGLKVDGVVGDDTREAMNVPVEARIEQLAIALERWRWIPRELGTEYAWVNVPELQLRVVGGGEPRLTSRVIVGHSSRPTPSLRGEIRQLIFNPSWSVPTTIATEDLLPKIQRDPEFLARGRYRVYTGWGAEQREIDPATVDWAAQRPDRLPYRFVQDPGPNNSLGRIKFVFNNPYDIYLHDTPAKSLFTLRTRMFSSGCVRLERAHELADLLLAGYTNYPEWTANEILEDPTTQTVNLEKRLPIYLVYITAWVTEDGVVNFRPDLYGRDVTVAAALAARNAATDLPAAR